jgi:hypothetical protein
MGNPRKSTEEKLLQGTYRKDRDPAKKINKNVDKYKVIKNKLEEVENLIKDTPVNNNEKKLIDLGNLYQKLMGILQTPPLEKNEIEYTSITAKLLDRKKN